MNYLLDTCVVSEFTKPVPNSGVIKWIKSVDQGSLFISAITFGEIVKGISRLDDGKKKSELMNWFKGDLRLRFAQRTVDLDAEVMIGWGDIMGMLDRKGFHVPIIDSLIAACVMAHDMTLVTKNTKDFAVLGINVMNPWS